MHSMRKSLKTICGLAVLSMCFSFGAATTSEAMVGGKPVIGITWKSNQQDYTAFKKIIELAGGIPVELGQAKNHKITYNTDGTISKDMLYPSGMLKEKYANAVKDNHYKDTNVEDVMKDIDGVFFTGGEDVSPTLFKKPDIERNKGEEINATRDVSDYTLMSYCISKNVPTFAVCRGEQVMGIVSGVTFIQDIPTYYSEQGKTYNDLHRMPPGTPNRTYARHDVHILPVKSHLREIVGADELHNVSSWHHQAIGSLKGTPLIQTAETMYNGVSIVEGIEDPRKTFVVGLQFHPENDLKQVIINKKDPKDFCDQEISMKFFKELVKAASQKK